jgi:hypothetical protein
MGGAVTAEGHVAATGRGQWTPGQGLTASKDGAGGAAAIRLPARLRPKNPAMTTGLPARPRPKNPAVTRVAR